MEISSSRRRVSQAKDASRWGYEWNQESSHEISAAFRSDQTYKGGNGFGGSREKVRPGLMHAANDLAAPPGTPVLAMDEGVVLAGPYEFFRGTYALEVRHPQFIARYCEIARIAEVGLADRVKEGQVIAYVG